MSGSRHQFASRQSAHIFSFYLHFIFGFLYLYFRIHNKLMTMIVMKALYAIFLFPRNLISIAFMQLVPWHCFVQTRWTSRSWLCIRPSGLRWSRKFTFWSSRVSLKRNGAVCRSCERRITGWLLRVKDGIRRYIIVEFHRIYLYIKIPGLCLIAVFAVC